MVAAAMVAEMKDWVEVGAARGLVGIEEEMAAAVKVTAEEALGTDREVKREVVVTVASMVVEPSAARAVVVVVVRVRRAEESEEHWEAASAMEAEEGPVVARGGTAEKAARVACMAAAAAAARVAEREAWAETAAGEGKEEVEVAPEVRVVDEKGAMAAESAAPDPVESRRVAGT
eukprot:scaffold54230_cov28-Tisochrysis_lutea.AAC.1